jgi:DNA-binding NtrC family response regulator
MLRLSLKYRIALILAGFAVITFGLALVLVRSTFRMEELLAEEGYTVESAAAGEAAVKKVEKKAPDLVILDIRLPGMNGSATFQSIHRMEPKLPVIIMTAYGSPVTLVSARP